jgi:hypothetical protein
LPQLPTVRLAFLYLGIHRLLLYAGVSFPIQPPLTSILLRFTVFGAPWLNVIACVIVVPAVSNYPRVRITPLC